MTDERKHPAQSTADPKPGWPRDVRPISLDGMDHLGVGGDGTLYWDGKPIVVRKGIELTWWQNAMAAIAAFSAMAVAIVNVCNFIGWKPFI